jgi:hypothetical protein
VTESRSCNQLLPLMFVAIVPIPVAIPVMIVGQPPSRAFPVTFVVAATIVVRYHPDGARIWWATPVSVVPPPMMAHWIPIAFNPNKTRSGDNRPGDDARWRGRADFDTNGYLGEEDSSKQEREGEQLLFHQGTLCRVLAISQVSSESIRYRSCRQVNCARPNVERCKIATRVAQRRERPKRRERGSAPPFTAQPGTRPGIPGITRSFLATAAGVRW